MRGLLLLALLASLVPACGKNEKPPPKSKGITMGQESGPAGSGAGTGAAAMAGGTAAKDARMKFNMQCATCHGADGTGNTPVAAELNPKPRNYTDAAWQASVTDDDLAKIIVMGGQGVGKSAMMPANPDLKDRPDVVAELVKIIRGFKK